MRAPRTSACFRPRNLGAVASPCSLQCSRAAPAVLPYSGGRSKDELIKYVREKRTTTAASSGREADDEAEGEEEEVEAPKDEL